MNQFDLNEGAPKSLSAEQYPPLPQSAGKPAGRWPFQVRLHPAASQQGGQQRMPHDGADSFVT